MIHEKIEIQLKNSAYKANLYTYFLDNSPEIAPERKRPVVLICPGGGYRGTSDREAEALAVKFMAMGYHAAILRYSVDPARFPEALLQLATAVSMLRENADKWHIDTEKIVVQGSSAGGHLAASLGVFWNTALVTETLGIDAEKVRPNGLMLSYPVITSGAFETSSVGKIGCQHSCCSHGSGNCHDVEQYLQVHDLFQHNVLPSFPLQVIFLF